MMMPSITFSRRVTIVTSLPSEKLLNSNTLSNNVSPATSQDSTSRTREGTTSRRCRRSLHDRGNHIELCELFEMLMTTPCRNNANLFLIHLRLSSLNFMTSTVCAGRRQLLDDKRSSHDAFYYHLIHTHEKAASSTTNNITDRFLELVSSPGYSVRC